MLEALESRIAPATLVGQVLTYTDLDGDLVKVVFSHAAMTAGDFSFSTGAVDGFTSQPQALTKIVLTGRTGGNFSLLATPHLGHGDSHANVGEIESISTALGAIAIDGDLGQANFTAPSSMVASLRSLSVLSLGKTAVSGGHVNFSGVSVLNVRTDIENVEVDLAASAVPTALIHVGGSLIGGSLANGAYLNSQAKVLALQVGGSLIGDVGFAGGSVELNGAGLRSVSIGGSVLGGAGSSSGTLYMGGSGPTTVINVAGNVEGRDGAQAGLLSCNGAALLRVGGSLIGSGAGTNGDIFAYQSVGVLVIGHNLQGGDNTSANSITQSGYVQVTGNIGTLVIGGSLIAGRQLSSGGVTESGTLGVTGVIGRAVLGSIQGNSHVAAYLSAGGNGASAAKLAIGSLTVRQSVSFGSIVAGYDAEQAAGNTNTGIGSIVIGGNLSASFITAGANKGADGIPGTADDGTLSNTAALHSIYIGGAYTGVAGSAQPYYIFAPVIDRLVIGRAVYTQAMINGGLVFNAIGSAKVVL